MNSGGRFQTPGRQLQAEYEKLQEQEEALSADSRKRKTGQGIIQRYHAEQRQYFVAAKKNKHCSLYGVCP